MFYAKQALKGKIVQQFTFLSLCTARTHVLFMCKECAVKSSNSAKITMTLEQQELTDNLAIVYLLKNKHYNRFSQNEDCQ